MFIEDEEMMEASENVGEQTTEEPVESETATAEEEKPVKMYTEEELNQRVDELLPKKLERRVAKIRKEYEDAILPYKEAESVLNTALGTNNITAATENLRKYYEQKGVKFAEQRQQLQYSEMDSKILAEYEAKQIMDLGLGEVEEEISKLAAKGADKMTAREKYVFSQLMEYKQADARRNELLSMGVPEDVINSDSFKHFEKHFSSDTPIKMVYDIYTKTMPNQQVERIGSMKNGKSDDEGKLFTPEEVDKLTDKDYENPKIMERVRKSMLSWK